MKSNGFPRFSRLLDAGDFRYVFDNNCIKSSNRYFLLLATVSRNNTPRIGFVFSKKNIKRAVDRNRIKRISREFFRVHKKNLPKLDIVVLARSGIANQNNQFVVKQLDYLFGKLQSNYDKRAQP
ncbi:MAG: ribonuclease P protein component [Gammaproteobacteria bacterium]|nr:MAG: ribonuclease P protein component [Pseudomonadota bacterium]PIE38285.1 MAG: ribonuclease P protein component [Gammaproteobacteria bacterium]